MRTELVQLATMALRSVLDALEFDPTAVPDLGVRVISFRANTIKSNATKDELKLVLNDAYRMETQCLSI